MREALRGRNLTNVMAVVTRYFGGTLLGTGGLVRAYTAAVAEGLSNTEIVTRIRGIRLDIITDYTGLGRIQYLTAQMGIRTEDIIYSDKVEIHVIVPEKDLELLKKEITEGTNAQAFIEEKEECWFTEPAEAVRI